MKSWVRLCANKSILSFVVLALSYLTKFVIYRYLTGMDLGLDALQTIGAYAIIAAASIVLGSAVWLFRHAVTHIVLMVVIDLWMIANVLYFNANATYLNWQVILFADQLRGFEGSILAYLDWKQLFFLLITVVTSVYIVLYPARRASWRSVLWPLCGCGIAAAVLLSVGILLPRVGEQDRLDNAERWSIHDEMHTFVKGHSPLGHIGYVLYEAVRDGLVKMQSAMPLTHEEEVLLSRVCTEPTPPAAPQGHLVFVLVESLESWALDARDKEGREVMPALNAYIREHPVLLCKNVVSQQRYGRSGDGQLITQTGLLPLQTGVTCMSHGGNVYPNFAHFYPKSIILNPYCGVWNQRVTTYSYGYQQLREPDPLRHKVTDSLIFVWTHETLETAEEPTCALAITINTHAPFTSVRASMDLPEGYSKLEANYLQCARYLDRQLGRFLAWADSTACMQNSTIVITADHNHFPVKDGKGLCPLIITGPAVKENIYVPYAYQMDIFPTVCAAVGQADYAWHGFGINLFHPMSTRIVSPKEAQELSDKIIRNNYFFDIFL